MRGKQFQKTSQRDLKKWVFFYLKQKTQEKPNTNIDGFPLTTPYFSRGCDLYVRNYRNKLGNGIYNNWNTVLWEAVLAERLLLLWRNYFYSTAYQTTDNTNTIVTHSDRKTIILSLLKTGGFLMLIHEGFSNMCSLGSPSQAYISFVSVLFSNISQIYTFPCFKKERILVNFSFSFNVITIWKRKF